MSTEDQVVDLRHRAVRAPESAMVTSNFIRDLHQMPPEIIRKILKHLRSDNGVIGKAALALIKTLRTVKGPDGKVHPLYDTVVSEVYATSLNRLMFYHFEKIPHHSNPKNRFVNLLIPIAMPCIIGVPPALCPSPHIHHIRICLYAPAVFTKIVHTWIDSLGSVELLELQTHNVYDRTERYGGDGENDSVILPEGSSTAQRFFALYEYDMCKIDDMLGVVGKRSDGYGSLRENFTCVWQVARGESLKSLGPNHVPERKLKVYYALEPSLPSVEVEEATT